MAAVFSKKEDKPKMKDIESMTTEDIEKYLEERKAKTPSEQSEKDKVDESVAMQEKESGTEDSQTAKDRVDEADGEDSALKAEEKPKEKAAEEKTEPIQEANKDIALAEKGTDLAEQIREVLKALSEEEYDDLFSAAHRRHIDRYVGEHKNDRPMPAVSPERERPKVTLL